MSDLPGDYMTLWTAFCGSVDLPQCCDAVEVRSTWGCGGARGRPLRWMREGSATAAKLAEGRARLTCSLRAHQAETGDAR